MTGANRLLIGFGWPLVVLVSCWRRREPELEIPIHQRLEMRWLLWATLYSFVIPVRQMLPLPPSVQGLNWMDAVVLFAMFVLYARAAAQGKHEEAELVGPAALIDGHARRHRAPSLGVAMLVYATVAIFVAAEPFAEGLVEIGHHLPIDEFLLVQWVAPLASESPEFLIALLFAWRMRGHVGIGALISSKVNQWTLLVGAMPMAFASASGELIPAPARRAPDGGADPHLRAVAARRDLDRRSRFSRLEAVLLAAAFFVQLFFTEAAVRLAFAYLYLADVLGADGGRAGSAPSARRRAQAQGVTRAADILVIGAGVVGLACGAALARAGRA